MAHAHMAVLGVVFFLGFGFGWGYYERKLIENFPDFYRIMRQQELEEELKKELAASDGSDRQSSTS